MSQDSQGEREITTVHGLAIFRDMHISYLYPHAHEERGRWTDEEIAKITAVMTEINEGARRYFGCIDSDPQGIQVGWYFVKRPFGPTYWSWLWTWQGSTWGHNDLDKLITDLRNRYDWALEGKVMRGI